MCNFQGFQSCDGKLEKADILERTVAYLHSLNQQHTLEAARGFGVCLREVENFLERESVDRVGASFRSQLIRQLRRRAQQLLPPTDHQQQVASGFHDDKQVGGRLPLQAIGNLRCIESMSSGLRSTYVHVRAKLERTSDGSRSDPFRPFIESTDCPNRSHESAGHVIRRELGIRSSFGTENVPFRSRAMTSSTVTRPEADGNTKDVEQDREKATSIDAVENFNFRREFEFRRETSMTSVKPEISKSDERSTFHPKNRTVAMETEHGGATHELFSSPIWRPWNFNGQNN